MEYFFFFVSLSGTRKGEKIEERESRLALLCWKSNKKNEQTQEF